MELFPAKVANGAWGEGSNRRGRRSRSPQRRRLESSHHSIAAIVHTVSSADQQPRRSHRIDESEDLFPKRVGGVTRSDMDSFMTAPSVPLEKRISSDGTSTTVELFPDKARKLLEDRTSGQRTLAERIQEDNTNPEARELFPELLRNEPNRRQRRRKAEDHF